jgi:uncharacterized protein (TIGR02246 family)
MDKITENTIKHLAAQADEAWNTGDAPKMASYWGQNGLNVSPTGDAFESHQAIEADLERSLSGFLKGSKHELKVDHVVVGHPRRMARSRL